MRRNKCNVFCVTAQFPKNCKYITAQHRIKLEHYINRKLVNNDCRIFMKRFFDWNSHRHLKNSFILLHYKLSGAIAKCRFSISLSKDCNFLALSECFNHFSVTSVGKVDETEKGRQNKSKSRRVFQFLKPITASSSNKKQGKKRVSILFNEL